MSEVMQTADGRRVTRGQVEIGGEDRRVYTDIMANESWPSVSTVLDARPTPDKDDTISSWKERNHGDGDREHWKTILAFKGYRGTLAHYKAQQPLTDRDLRSDDEYEAYEELSSMVYRHDDALRQAREDIQWVLGEFEQQRRDWNLTPETARAVETYVVNDDVGYAGQFDLAWDLPNGETCLGDLKTSNARSISQLFDRKFPRIGMQLVAYAEAVNFEVDDLVVFWASPDKREAAAIPVDQWPKRREDYWRDFREIAETAHQETFDDFE